MKRLILIAVFGLVLVAETANAGEYSKEPDRSIFVGFELGAGLDMGSEARFPEDTYHTANNPGDPNPEAYSLGSFMFGLYGGFRFSENIGLEMGWHEQQHQTAREWGGTAEYELAHLALRLALPTDSRQTFLLRVGPALGGFSYGQSNLGFFEDNSRVVFGGLLAASMEHELAMNMIWTVNLTYLPMVRFGGGEKLQLCMHVPPEEAQYHIYQQCDMSEPYSYTPSNSDVPWEWVNAGEKDFSDNQFVQILWITMGLQFDWILR